MGEKSPIVILVSDWTKLNLEDFLFVDSTGLSHQLIVSISWLPLLKTLKEQKLLFSYYNEINYEIINYLFDS